MSSSLCYAFLLVARLEAMGSGAQWRHLWDAPGDMSIATAGIMVVVDGVLMLLVGYIVDRFYGEWAREELFSYIVLNLKY